MKNTMLVAIVLIVLGVLALGYEGITYMTQEEIVDIGPLDIDVEKEETIPVPRIVGLVLLVGGVVTAVYASTKG